MASVEDEFFRKAEKAEKDRIAAERRAMLEAEEAANATVAQEQAASAVPQSQPSTESSPSESKRGMRPESIRHGTRKKYLLLACLLGVVAIGYAIAGPYITICSINRAIKERDSEKLSDLIDFPTLRANLKDQLNAKLLKHRTTELKDNPFDVFAAAIAPNFVDRLVDSAVTPTGLAQMTIGVANARFSFDGFSKCSVWVKNTNNQEARLVLTREFLTWKLSNFVLPDTDELISKSAPVSPSSKDDNASRAQIHELEVKRELSIKSAKLLKLFTVKQARFYYTEGGFKHPAIEMIVVNNTGHPISRAYFRGVLNSPGRAIPWVEDTFNYIIPGGLESGETAKWELEPNMFGKWSKAPKDPTDLVLSVFVTGIDGPDKQSLTSEFTNQESEELQGKLKWTEGK